MQFDLGQIHPQKCHILHDKRIDTGLYDLSGQRFGIMQFILEKQCIERAVHPRTEPVGIFNRSHNVFKTVCRRMSRPETRPADIYGIRTVIDRRPGTLKVACRCQQFDHSFCIVGSHFLVL